MRIRPYRDTDLEAVASVFTRAVHGLAAGAYDADQLAAWAPQPPDPAQWRERLRGRHTLVAECDGELLGFLAYEANGHIDMLFAAPGHARRGVATALYRQAEAVLMTAGIGTLHTEASLVARPFFGRHGFEVVREEQVERRGAWFRRYAMRKQLDRCAGTMPANVDADADHSSWMPPAGSPQARALAHVATRSLGEPIDPTLRVTLNFHPDRLHAGVPFLRVLAEDGVYRSQFETGTSNGGLTAHPGGDRWQWESRLFGGAYDEAAAAERPKYGALNFRRRATGGSPRFGSAHLRLRGAVLARTTFCYPDSVYEPAAFGVAERMALIALANTPQPDPLDDYIEAQVHGPVALARDVEALVLDPCYRGTEIETMARALPCALEWHPGFRLSVDALRRHPDYRGARYVELGCALARDGCLTPATIGEAARSGAHDPQDLKKVWHYLARFGGPGSAG